MPDFRSIDPEILKRMFSPGLGEHGHRERVRWMIQNLPGPKALTEHINAVEKAGVAAIECVRDDPNPAISVIAVTTADGLDQYLTSMRAFRDAIQRFVDAIHDAKKEHHESHTKLIEHSELDVLARAVLEDHDLSASEADSLSDTSKKYLVWLGWKKAGQSAAVIRDRWNHTFPSYHLGDVKKSASSNVRLGLSRIQKWIEGKNSK